MLKDKNQVDNAPANPSQSADKEKTNKTNNKITPPDAAQMMAADVAQQTSLLADALGARQNELMNIAIKNSAEIRATSQDPNDLTKRLEWDDNIIVNYHEISIGQQYAIQTMLTELNELERHMLEMAQQARAPGKQLPKEYNSVFAAVQEKRRLYNEALWTLFLGIDSSVWIKCNQTDLKNVADAWEIRNRYSLPNLAGSSPSSSTSTAYK